MKYSETTCYWCGKDLTNKMGYSSLATDTIQTMRNFCCEEHILKFKEKATLVRNSFGKTYQLPPYQGKKNK